MVLIAGILSDKYTAKIVVPATLIFQGAVMGAYMFCHDPTSNYAYFLSIF